MFFIFDIKRIIKSDVFSSRLLLGGGPGLILVLCGIVAFTKMLSLTFYLFSCFSVLFSIVTTSLGEERAGLSASRVFL